MGRLKVTPKGKRKPGPPVTRIGKKQYMKRRYAAQRNVDRAGSNNLLAKEYVKRNLTASQNYVHAGITTDPSENKAQRLERKKHVKKGIEKKALTRPEAAKGTIAVPLSEDECTLVINLMDKYGNNFKRMAFDTKLNPFQLNARQLQRKVVAYLKYERAAFPEMYEQAEAAGIVLDDFSDPALRKQRLHSIEAKQA
jgi:uncharacterized protein YaiL (DUF2058 family)